MPYNIVIVTDENITTFRLNGKISIIQVLIIQTGIVQIFESCDNVQPRIHHSHGTAKFDSP